MNRSFTITQGKQSIAGTVVPVCKRFVMIGVVALVASIPAIAQNSEVQQKLASVKLSMAENKQRLEQYQWMETTQLNLKGDPKPPSENLCHYGPDGQVQKTLIGVPPEPSGGRLKKRIIAKKTGEIKDYMGDVKGLLSMYVPTLNPQRMEQAYQAGKLSLNPAGGLMNLVFRDYAQPGDQMTLTFDTATRKNHLSKYQHLHGRDKRRSDSTGSDGQPARWNQLRGAVGSQRQRQETRRDYVQLELPENGRLATLNRGRSSCKSSADAFILVSCRALP